MRRFVLAALMLLVLVSSASAQGRRSRRGWSNNQGWSQGWTEAAGGAVMVMPPAQPAQSVQSSAKSVGGSDYAGNEDAMDEVNAKRAQKGLRPLQKDPLLSQGAFECAKRRASRGIHGHLPESDFSCLPPGANATVGGAGALEDSWGWETCAYDSTQYTVGGAAWVRGRDGLRYMSFFGR